MLISEICIRRPVFATVLSLLIVTLGAIFFTKLQIRGIPDIDPPVINVNANYYSADALYMEKQITTPIEKILKTIKNLDFMSSSSETGSSNITLSFKLSTDIEIALNDVRSKISEISQNFPEDMKPPSVSKMDSDSFPSIWLGISSDKYDKLQLTRIIEDNVKIVLDKLPTVGRAVVYGGKYYSMRIEPDPVKLFQYKISPIEIEDAIRKQNKDYPAGNIKTDIHSFTLRLNASLSKPEDFEKIIIKNNNGALLKLSDIAKVSLAPAEDDIILRYNGKRAMAIGLVKQAKSNIIELSGEVHTELRKIRKLLPQGIKIDIAYDGALPINASIRSVFWTIAEALILVVFVTYLFLASARITLIPFVTIPVSLIGTFSVMYFMGFSINTFTLLAMILAIGLVVDDAIVMLENIFRHYELGQTPMEAATSAVKEVSFAIVAMTITLASVFLPIGFMEGFIGKLFIEFAWTLAFCVLFSGFVALTLTPMMASRMIKRNDKPHAGFLAKFDYFLKILQGKYLYYLNLAFDNRKQFFYLAGSSIIVLIVSFATVNKSFVPEEDDGFVQIFFTGPEGSSVKQSETAVVKAEQILDTYKDIFGYFEAIGWGGSDSAVAFVVLKDWGIRSRSQEQIRMELNGKFNQIPDMSIFAVAPRSLESGGSGHPI
jgi:hydrophobic/amphiphilic exporter-1 (mainly G- bacteria), HAE1 family